MDAERMMYITNLMVETLPKEQKTKEVLDQLNIENKGIYVVLHVNLSRGIRSLFSDLKEEEASEWKLQFQRRINDLFEDSQVTLICMMNLQPMRRTFLLKLEDKLEEGCISKVLIDTYNLLNQHLMKTYKTSVSGGYGNVVHQFLDIGVSYKQSRFLNEYYYVIGIGKCMFYHEIGLDNEGSLVEYKYLHHFEDLLKNENWVEIADLLKAIKKLIIDNRVNNSKIMYIYKEVFSNTIRYLFRDSNRYFEEIKTLNKGILRFEHLFDDISEIHEFYLEVFEVLSDNQLYSGLNPHIRKTLNIIKGKYGQPLTLQYIADELMISTAHLSRLFKREMDISFKQYLTNYRMIKAKELLVDSNKKIKDIRVLVGYQTPTQFVRAFKAVEGMTPTKYRRTGVRHHNPDQRPIK